MSNDKKQRAAAARMRAQFIEKSDGRIRSLEDKVTIYVQGTNPYICENDVKRLIQAAYRKIVEDMPFTKPTTIKNHRAFMNAQPD